MNSRSRLLSGLMMRFKALGQRLQLTNLNFGQIFFATEPFDLGQILRNVYDFAGPRGRPFGGSPH